LILDTTGHEKSPHFGGSGRASTKLIGGRGCALFSFVSGELGSAVNRKSSEPRQAIFSEAKYKRIGQIQFTGQIRAVAPLANRREIAPMHGMFEVSLRAGHQQISECMSRTQYCMIVSNPSWRSLRAYSEPTLAFEFPLSCPSIEYLWDSYGGAKPKRGER
jgi:hypothetical protein